MKTYFSKVDKAAFEGEIDSKKTGLFILKNDNGLELSVTNFGARVVELFVPDRNGDFADVVLGHARAGAGPCHEAVDGLEQVVGELDVRVGLLGSHKSPFDV